MADILIHKPLNQHLLEEDTRDETKLSVLDICTGAGGQAIGLEEAGFVHEAAIEIDMAACQTLRLNRPSWSKFQGSRYVGRRCTLSPFYYSRETTWSR